MESLATPILEPNGKQMAQALTGAVIPRAKRTSIPPLSKGRPIEFDAKSLVEYQAKPPSIQKEVLKASWADAAFILAERLKRFSTTVSRKDFGRLQQLATSAGVAYDKVIPKNTSDNTLGTGNVIFNLFGSLGVDKIKAILAPQPVQTLQPYDERAVDGQEES